MKTEQQLLFDKYGINGRPHTLKELSKKFDQVSFEGEVVPVKQKLEIFQDCRKPVGIEGIFKSFNEQFAAK